MRRILLPITAAVLLAATACGGHKPPTAAPVAGSHTPTHSAASSTPSTPSTPTLAVGQTVTVNTKPDGLIIKQPGTYQVTLSGMKTATSVTDPSDNYTSKAEPGKVIGCVALKVKNTGTSSGDLYPFANPQWQGASGQVADAELAAGVSCSALGLTDTDLTSAPNPGPGQFATGSDALEFPVGAGKLLFADRSGAPMFTVTVPPAR